MTVTIELPADIEQALREQWQDLPRAVLEAVAIEGYRKAILSHRQVGELLGLDWWDVEKFLSEQRVERYSAEALEQDLDTLKKLDQTRVSG